MEWLSFQNTPLGVDFAVLAGAAVVVWAAGTRLARQADQVVRRTGLGEAVVGLLLLGGLTSLPELAVTVTAAASGAPALAANNILGGVAMQVAILAVADAVYGRDALTSEVVEAGVLLQGALGVLLLSIAVLGVLVGSGSWLGIGTWSWAIGMTYAAAIWVVARHPGPRTWVPRGREEREPRPAGREDDGEAPSLRALLPGLAATAGAILVAGFLLARTGEAIAHKSGLGSSFVGAVLVAICTSLPEVSTVLGAIRVGRYGLAISDIFGTNLMDVALLLVVDAVASGEPVLGQLGDFSAVAGLLGIVTTALFVIGLIERRDRAVLRMGIDSLLVLVTYLGGLILLYRLR